MDWENASWSNSFISATYALVGLQIVLFNTWYLIECEGPPLHNLFDPT